jgi:hypothetical protein
MRYLIVLAGALLAGCVSQPAGKFHSVATGQPVDADPKLMAKFMQDRAICDGEAAKAGLASTERLSAVYAQNVNLVFDGCLAERGYVRR